MFTVAAIMVRLALAGTGLPAHSARWIIPIIPACAATVTLPATHAWWNVKSTVALALADASSSPNVSICCSLNIRLANNEEHSAPDYLRAEEVALRLITRAEQSSVNLTRKLERRGFDSISQRR